MRTGGLVISVLWTFAWLPQSRADADDNWGQWRGPEATGVSPGGNPPVEWSEEKNVRWKLEISGEGNSSPIVWGDRLYVLTAIKTDTVARGAQEETRGEAKEETPRQEEPRRRRRRRRFGGGPRPTNMYDFAVVAVDRQKGVVIWTKTVSKQLPHESYRPGDGSFASNSPITDGEHIYAYFGSRGLCCLDMKGEVKWQKDFGDMKKVHEFGEGSSPVLHGDTIVVNWDHEGQSFVVALDKMNGEQRWKKDRDERTTWATPLVVEVKGKPQVIIPASGFTRGYDLASGELLWKCSGMTRNVIPSPVHGNGMVYVMSGFRGNALQAIRLAGADGDITGTGALVWTHQSGTSYVPSPLLYEDTLYFMANNRGIISCLDSRTGKAHYSSERLEGIRGVYASPVGAGGRVYITGRRGTTVVLKRGPEIEVLATNKLDERFDASATIAGNEIYLRGREYLYCISES